MYERFKPLVLKLMAVEIPPPLSAENSAYRSVQQFRACPAYLRYRMLGWHIFWVVVVLTLPILNVVVFLTANLVGWISLILIDLIVVAALAFIYFTIRIDYEMRSYTVTDRSLRIREGVFFIREMTLTYANIQNVKLSQGPLERYFGFRNLEVETAGGGGGPQGQNKKSPFSFHVGYLRGIDNAEEVRGLIQRRMEKSGTTAGEKPQPTVIGEDSEVAAYRAILDQTKRLQTNLAAKR